MFAFQRRTIEAATDFKFRPAINRFQSAEALFEGMHISKTPGSKVEINLGGVRDNVGASAAVDEVRVYRHAMAGIVPFLNAGDLSGQFVNRVDALIGVQTGVRGTAMNLELDFTSAFTGSFDKPARTERGLENENSVASTSFVFNQFTGGFTANLLVGGPKKNQALGESGFQFLQSFESKKGLNDTGFHVEGPRAVRSAADDAKRHFGKSAGGINGIVVAKDKKLRSGRSRERGPDGAKMIATMSLPNDLDECSTEQPFVSEKAGAAVGVVFFKAGRLDERKLAQRVHHAREAFLKVSEEGLRQRWLSHNLEMVAMRSSKGNRAAEPAVKRPRKL